MLAKVKKIFTIEVDYSKRIFGFDIIRGLSLIIVLYAHGRTKLEFLSGFNNLISILAFWCMDLFFVLSGFLIGTILIKLYNKENTFTFKTSYDFWIRRWFRTLPNYYLVMFITAGLWALGGNVIFFKIKFLMHALFLQTLVTPPPYFMMESWSLCLEEWFYLLFPLLLILINKLFFSQYENNIRIKKNLLIAIIIFFSIPIIFRTIAFYKHVPISWIDMTRMVFFRFDPIALGVFMAWISFYYKNFFIKYRNLFGIAALITTFIYIWYFYVVILLNKKGLQSLENNTFTTVVLYLIISSISCFSLVVYMMFVEMKTPYFLGKFITQISIISYSGYIFHRSVVMYIVDELFVAKTSIENILLFVLYFASTILLSILVYKFFEHPIMELREKLK